MSLEQAVLDALRDKPCSGGKLIERFQAEGSELVLGRAILVYGALANLRERGEAVVLADGPGEVLWGEPDSPPGPVAAAGFPPSFSLGSRDLTFIANELQQLTKGLPQHYFEELRRVVVADADRRVFHGERLPRAVTRAIAELGPRAAVRRLLRRVERGGPVALGLGGGASWRWLAIPMGFVLLLLIVRLFVFGLHTMPKDSSSMAPALIPPHEGGDRWIVSNLLAYLLRDPARGDIVLFKRSGETFVKRVMGLPGELVEIRNGDLFLDGKRLVKERAFLDGVKVPFFGLADFDRTDAPRGWRQKGNIHNGYRVPDGTMNIGAPMDCRDVVVTARVRVAKRGSLTFVLDDHDRRAGHTLVLKTEGYGGVSVAGVEAAKGAPFRLEPAREYEVWLTNADRVFRVEIDGREVARARVPREGALPRLSIVAEGEAELSALEVARDLVHLNPHRQFKEVRLGEEEYYVLGDNSANSKDSRHFRGGVMRNAILGCVLGVAWPPSRARWID